MRTRILLCATSTALLLLSACSGSSSSSNSQTVMAQSSYSTSSLSGTYSVVWTNVASFEKGNLNDFYTGVGTLQLNGSGSITAGTLSLYIEASTTPCVYSVTGTYSLQSTALGTASLNLSSSTNGCTTAATWQIALAAADGGLAIQMARSDGSVSSGSAIKQ
jgi:hypothetical protein